MHWHHCFPTAWAVFQGCGHGPLKLLEEDGLCFGLGAFSIAHLARESQPDNSSSSLPQMPSAKEKPSSDSLIPGFMVCRTGFLPPCAPCVIHAAWCRGGGSSQMSAVVWRGGSALPSGWVLGGLLSAADSHRIQTEWKRLTWVKSYQEDMGYLNTLGRTRLCCCEPRVSQFGWPWVEQRRMRGVCSFSFFCVCTQNVQCGRLNLTQIRN